MAELRYIATLAYDPYGTPHLRVEVEECPIYGRHTGVAMPLGKSVVRRRTGGDALLRYTVIEDGRGGTKWSAGEDVTNG